MAEEVATRLALPKTARTPHRRRHEAIPWSHLDRLIGRSFFSYLKGLGSAAATEGGELPVGNHTMTGVIVDQAASSVFPVHDVLCDGGLYVQDKDGAVIYKDGKATPMVPRGNLHAFPCGKTQACQDLESHAGLLKALKVKDEHVRRMALRHWRRGHINVPG